MKYLKTYNKLFESNSTEVTLNSESDWNKVNDSTIYIVIDYNIKKWHKLPKNLEKLITFSDKLTSLPNELPNSLKLLSCFSNYLKELPTLPENLKELYCQLNKLNKLPTLPKSLIKLRCNHNNLTELPKLPDTLSECVISDNPLEKLPEGITKELLIQNDKDWIKKNALKWILNKPTDFKLLKDYLYKNELEKLEKIHPELISQDQFGFFGLKNEDIKLKIEEGDLILTGRFKNKQTIVKDIDTDDKNQPTINGKPILKFRIFKNLPKKYKDKIKLNK